MSTNPTPSPAQLGATLAASMKQTADLINAVEIALYNTDAARASASGQPAPTPPILTSIDTSSIVADEVQLQQIFITGGSPDQLYPLISKAISHYQYVPPPPPPPPTGGTSLVGFYNGVDSQGNKYYTVATNLSDALKSQLSSLSDGQSYSDPNGKGTFTYHKKPYLADGVFSTWFTQP